MVELDDVALVTVTFESAQIASKFAASARHFNSVFIVDNASADGSAEAFGTELPQAIILRQKTNLGFGTANNVGLNIALRHGFKFVLFMNPDCSISPDSALLLKKTLQQYPNAAVVSPAVIGKQGVRSIFRWDFREPYIRKSPKSTVVSSLCGQVVDQACIDGACFMVLTDLFLDVGAFTEDLFLFCEEDDINLRVARAGYASLFNPNAKATHIGGGSTRPSLRIELRKAYNVRWSRLFMTDRYISPSARLREAIQICLVAPIALIFFLLIFNRRKTIRWLGWGLAGIDGLKLTRFFRSLI